MAKQMIYTWDRVRYHGLNLTLLISDRKKLTPLAIADAVCGLSAEDPATMHLMCLARNPDYDIDELRQLWLNRKELILTRGVRGEQFLIPTEHAVAFYGATADQFLKNSAFDLYHKYGVMAKAKRNDPRYGDPAQYDVQAPELQEKQKELLTKLAGSSLRHSAVKNTLKIPYTAGPLLQHIVDARLAVQLQTGGWDSDDYEYARMNDFLPGLHWDVKSLKSARAKVLKWYLANYAPASKEDIIYWSGWSKTVVMSLLKNMSGDLVRVSIEDESEPYYIIKADARKLNKAEQPSKPIVHLLPAMDNYTQAHENRKRIIKKEHIKKVFDKRDRSANTITVNGEIAGTWKLDIKKANVSLQFFDSPSKTIKHSADKAAASIVKFIKSQKKASKKRI